MPKRSWPWFARNEDELMIREDLPIAVLRDEYGRPVEYVFNRSNE